MAKQPQAARRRRRLAGASAAMEAEMAKKPDISGLQRVTEEVEPSIHETWTTLRPLRSVERGAVIGQLVAMWVLGHDEAEREQAAADMTEYINWVIAGMASVEPGLKTMMEELGKEIMEFINKERSNG